ncbi:MAG: tetratricopeptide repeat protein [Verrucomicrobiota bacterium]|jgi:tetratricopeptide (TPR) repeat protein
MKEPKLVESCSPEVRTPILHLGSAAVPIPNFLSDFWCKKKTTLICLLLFGFVVWVFWPSLRCGFLFWDDTADVTSEPHVNSGLSLGNITWAFFTLEHCNWYPLNWLSHMLDCKVYGLEPWGHHLTSVLIHALNSVLVFVTFRKMTGAAWRSLAVALLFGLHPLRVQSVTWICERKDVLSLFFWMLTLLAYAQYAQECKKENGKVIKFYSLALLFFSLGLMSKAMLVTLPFILLLFDYWPLELYRKKGGARMLMEKLPFLVLATADSWITLKAQQTAGITDEMKSLPMGDKIGNALISYVRYLGKFFWPENLSVYYPHPGHWPLFKVICAGLFVLGVSVMAVGLRRRMPYMLVGWFWYLGTLVPVIGLVQLLSQSMADRYTYIPMIGFTLLLVWFVADLTGQWRYKPVMMLVIGTSMIIACVVRTRYEISFFKDDITLWRRAVAVTKNEYNWCPHYALGTVLCATPQRDDALNEFQESVRINPNYAKSQLFLGNALERKNHFDEAIFHYQRALELNPDWGVAWYNCGFVFFEKGEVDKAIGHLKRAVQYEPNNTNFHNALAAALGFEQQGLEANIGLREFVKQNPDRPDLLNNLAWRLATYPDPKIRNGAEAVQLAERACQLTHYQITATVVTLAAAYAEAGRFEEAVTNAQLASSMALKSGEEVLLQKNEMMLGLFRTHQPYYEGVPPQFSSPSNHQ